MSAVAASAPQPGWANATDYQQRFLYTHNRGAAVRLLGRTLTDVVTFPAVPRPGNPGPQTAFQYNSPRFAPVVKYVEQLR